MPANLENSAVVTELEKVSFHPIPKEQVKLLSRVRLLATPWTVAHQAPPYMGFARQEYWSGVPLPSLEFTSGFFQIVNPLRAFKSY